MRAALVLAALLGAVFVSAVEPDPAALRAALVRELRAVPKEAVGAESASLLESPRLKFSIAPIRARGRVAEYVATRGAQFRGEIVIDEDFAAEAGASGGVEVLARRLASTVVHELEHVRDLSGETDFPDTVEAELAAYGAEPERLVAAAHSRGARTEIRRSRRRPRTPRHVVRRARGGGRDAGSAPGGRPSGAAGSRAGLFGDAAGEPERLR